MCSLTSYYRRRRVLAIAALIVDIAGVFFLLGWRLDPAGGAPGPAPMDRYQLATSTAIKTGLPLVIQYGAAWCGPCHECERLYGAELRTCGVYLHLDCERDRYLIDRYRIPEPRTIPAVYVWRWAKATGWRLVRVALDLPSIGIYVGEQRKR